MQPPRNFQVRDAVLLKKYQSPRNRWPTAKVVVTHPDHQGHLRSVMVLTCNGSRLERPVNKIVLLIEAKTGIPRLGARGARMLLR